ncbi:DUF4040 domain-containing protein [Neoehrlichia mikurensis]|uniref:DUF4040 domain-containing protein n=1 Tax=Neoehrlichia mikurensis TaxID=89586 RepID=A0A9Q9C0V1_9RICK|nr:DUF4040 domain-containing protein [Neoehrlichia mikurensis]QXK91839.1 DUF4040 domain-containing protein [Neoehrlichia mikurensis]QXK93052.1 DUF4040 domain-containing protein [Neoehrlichia mikurensis]QXK93530.1 DUF4040 domain-containing protein [Neoehrlichia mikurensis]UTO55514.1 DUF4040 domain-containing protein [Neoehrlichia mikurensis]UTO56435.1 DUF4040 domain-containing protein [Neoehrlichia mikurensis]
MLGDHVFSFNLVLLVLLLITSSTLIFLKNLTSNVVVMCIFSLIMTVLYLILDAPDVAITEASVGAGLSTVLMLYALSLIKVQIAINNNCIVKLFIAVICSVCMLLSLLYAINDLPEFGSFYSAANQNVVPYYMQNTNKYMGIPNVVTAILASFRGYDTLCETIVVFTAALCVFLLLKRENIND